MGPDSTQIEPMEAVKRLAVIAIWIAGFLGLPHVPYGAGLFVPLVAVLDIVLVFMVFEAFGDDDAAEAVPQ